MVLIGYSVRLAFPRRKDLVRLSRILDAYGLPQKLPVRDVLRAVLKEKDRFSNDLSRERDDFMKKYQMGESNSRLYDHPFWAAIRAAVLVSAEDEGRRERATYQLVLDTGSRRHQLALLASSLSEDLQDDLPDKFIETHAPGYDYLIASDGSDTDSSPVDSILDGRIPKGVPGLQYSSVWKLVREGVLLFHRNEAGFWELSSTLPDPEDEVRALVRRDLALSFRRHYEGIGRDSFYDSQYSGWREVDLFQGRGLRGHKPIPPSLEDIRCLRETLAPPQIHLEDGVTLHEGYLGIPPLLPTIKVLEADEVTMHRAVDSSGRKTIDLLREGDTFEIPTNDDSPIDGEYNIVARSSGEVVTQRRVVFRSRGLQQEYKGPTNPGTWIVEGSRIDCYRMSGEALHAESVEDGKSSAKRVSFPVADPSRAIAEAGWRANTNGSGEEGIVSRFIECCSAIASNRKGISTPVFLRLIEEVLKVEDRRLKWEIARSWVESGCFERAMRTRWRGASYFAVSPHLVVYSRDGEYEATLVGLASNSLRVRLIESARRLDLWERSRRALSPWSPPVLSWKAEGRQQFDLFCKKCELPPPEEIVPLNDLIAPIEEVALLARSGAAHYEFHKSWSWKGESFSSPNPAPDTGVQIERLCRKDRPDLFRVLIDGEEICSTHSRNWSLLFVYALRSQLPFEKRGCGGLVRGVRGQVYLPLAIARYIAVVGGFVPGPCRVKEDWTYAYDCSEGRLRDRIISGLWKTSDSDSITKRLKWIAALADRFRGEHGLIYRIPQGLYSYLEDPHFRDVLRRLTSGPIPSRILPHLKKLERDIKSRSASSE